ncbi:MAG: hypothetical protein ABJF04_23390 [Reichenbachiella sp.]|uniref:hypothetical protein n=1 Tax=Reichenbachiella sp. TaxID=2184521 RepID=UPI0032632B9F
MQLNLTDEASGQTILNAVIHDHILDDILNDEMYLENSGSPYDPIRLDRFLSSIDTGQDSGSTPVLPVISDTSKAVLTIAVGKENIPLRLHYMELRNLSTNDLDEAVGCWAEIFDFSTTKNTCNAAQNGHLYIEAICDHSGACAIQMPEVKKSTKATSTIVSYGVVFNFTAKGNNKTKKLHGRIDPLARVTSKS